MKRVSVIIPAYNEEVVIRDTVQSVTEALEGLSNAYQWKLLLVNDGSRDNTGAVMEELASLNRGIKVLHHRTNCGRGKALKTGFEAASGDIVITLDADLSYSAEHISQMVEKMEADIVLASCYAPGGRVEKVHFVRALMSRIGNAPRYRALGGDLTVATCVISAQKREALPSLGPLGLGT